MSAGRILLVGLVCCAVANTTLGAPQFDQLELVSTQRVSRFDFDYTYRVQATNEEAPVTAISAVVTSSSATTIIVDANLAFPDMTAGATALSTDTFTLRQDRRFLFDLGSLVFQFEFDEPQLDTTAPTISAQVSTPTNAAGWHRDPVTVSFDCADAQSGIASCSEPFVVDADTPGLLVTGEAVDNSGNVAAVEVTIRLDSVAPDVNVTSPLGNPEAPQAYIEGQMSDALSGIETVSCAESLAATSDGLFGCMLDLDDGPASIAVQAIDTAGNSSLITVAFTLDTEPPILEVAGPLDGAVVAANEVVLSATVTEAALAEFLLNGAPVDADGDGSISLVLPVHEGANAFTLSARDTAGNSASKTVTVRRDTQAPVVTIRSPRDGLVTEAGEILLLGAVNDIVPGVVSTEDCQVSVNGVPATVTAGSYLATNVPLELGRNVLEVIAIDAAGNVDRATIEVTRQEMAGQHIRVFGGQSQIGQAGAPLAEPLQVLLEDANGLPVADRNVEFAVTRGDGVLSVDSASDDRRVTVTTNSVGVAQAVFQLGSRTGAGNDQVQAVAPGFSGDATFAFTSTPRPGTTLKIVSGDAQRAANGQALIKPLVVVAQDDLGNPVAGADVLFEISGRGRVDGVISVVKPTDADGRASVSYALSFGGPDDLGTVIARLQNSADLNDATVVFFAYPKARGVEVTTLSGVVLDDAEAPLEGATVHIENTAMTMVTNADGSFQFIEPPTGELHILIDGTTAVRDGPWPTLSFDVTVVGGTNNFLDAPVLLPELDAANARLAGGDSDVTLTMADVAGLELTVFANSLTCPNGDRECVVSISQVTRDRLPMAPPEGLTSGLAWTVQPSGAVFDPPAHIRLPNVDGLPPGQVADIFTFDHGLNEFVRVANASVDADGAFIASDPGMGIRVAGWSIPPVPPRPKNCGADPVTAGGDTGGGGGGDDDGGDEGGGDGGGGGDDDEGFDFEGRSDTEIRICIPGPCSGGRSGFRTQTGRAWGWMQAGAGVLTGDCPEGNAVVGVRG